MEGKREHNHPAEPNYYEINQAKAQLREGLERYLATTRNESPETFIPEVSESMYRAITHCDYGGILRKEDGASISPARTKQTKQEVWGLAEDQVTIVKKETIEPSNIKLETEEDPLSLPEGSYQGKLTDNGFLLKLSNDFPRPQE